MTEEESEQSSLEPRESGHTPDEADKGATPDEADSGAGEREPETAFEEFAATWVPPWARSMPELVIEPAADDPPEVRGGAFLAYASNHGQHPADGGVSRSTRGSGVDDEAEDLPDPDDFEPGMADSELRGAVEAILLVVDEPVTTLLLAQVLEEPTSRVEATLRALAEDYGVTGRGFELRRAAGGWRLYTRAEYAAYVERFILDGQQARLTQAALETLAVVAYKQPVTRSRISAIRGVNCDGVIKTLINRGLVEECGSEPESGAHLYRTTQLFLEKLGINGVEELPSLAPFLPDNVDEIDLAQR